MRRIFIWSLLLIAVFELFRTYLVMPLPGSQELESVQLAWALHHFRWWIRCAVALIVLISLKQTFQEKRKWLPVLMLLIAAGAVYVSNFILTAESLFQPPSELHFSAPEQSGLSGDAVVIGIYGSNEAKAYPVRYIAYHHQVFDSLDGVPVLVTYCSVCRSGRVYQATVNGITEGHLRLVGMTRYNAMFEDAATGSWWMQATGEAVAGPLNGQRMKEIPSVQMSLNEWSRLFPGSRVMLPDPASITQYDPEAKFEKGKSTGDLTRRDTASWKAKSWVIGVIHHNRARAYDWNELAGRQVINDTLGGEPIVVVLAGDHVTFTAFRKPGPSMISASGDTIRYEGRAFDLTGRAIESSIVSLERIPAYQEHWHSWKQFHGDDRYSLSRE
jgi:hypothetical protein